MQQPVMQGMLLCYMLLCNIWQLQCKPRSDCCAEYIWQLLTPILHRRGITTILPDPRSSQSQFFTQCVTSVIQAAPELQSNTPTSNMDVSQLSSLIPMFPVQRSSQSNMYTIHNVSLPSSLTAGAHNLTPLPYLTCHYLHPEPPKAHILISHNVSYILPLQELTLLCRHTHRQILQPIDPSVCTLEPEEIHKSKPRISILQDNGASH